MVRIAILDDSLLQREIIFDLVSDYAAKAAEIMDIRCFSTSQELADSIKADGRYDVYLLDILMPDIMGIDVAKAIRKYDSDCRIIFITSSGDFALDSYEVHAFNYILKPINRDKLFSTLDEALSRKVSLRGEDSDVTIKVYRRSEIIISISKIVYVDMFNRRLQYHIEGNNEVIEGVTLRVPFKDAVEYLLGSDMFAVIGVSSIVNLGKVSMISRDSITLFDGTELPVSKKYCAEFTDAWRKYWGK